MRVSMSGRPSPNLGRVLGLRSIAIHAETAWS
jgi:hypothetical protein